MSSNSFFDGLSSESILPFLEPFRKSSLFVAFSGGVDSTVLLHLLVQLRAEGYIDELQAVHINHGLSTLSDQWAEECQYLCDQWHVPLTLTRVTVPHDTGEGIEKAARNQRYQIFEQAVMNDGCLLMGHHQDDQAETVLMRLFRGTGLDGLQGMPQSRPLGEGALLRPLLHATRQDIEVYARHHQLSWIEDDSNTNERFSRNFLRQTILPAVEQRWPGASQRIADLTREISQTNHLLQVQVRKALQDVELHSECWWSQGFTQLNIARLEGVADALRDQVLRLWLKNNSGSVPSREHLGKIYAEIIHARDDAEPQMKLGEVIVRRYRGMLYLTPKYAQQSLEVEQWGWPVSYSITLSDGLTLTTEAVTEEMVTEGDVAKIALPKHPLRVLRRQHIPTDEKFAVAGKLGRKTLKRWLQEYHVPPWWRNRIPFVFDGDRMVAVPGLWVCPEYLVKTDSGCRVQCVQP